MFGTLPKAHWADDENVKAFLDLFAESHGPFPFSSAVDRSGLFL